MIFFILPYQTQGSGFKKNTDPEIRVPEILDPIFLEQSENNLEKVCTQTSACQKISSKLCGYNSLILLILPHYDPEITIFRETSSQKSEQNTKITT